MDEFGVNNDNGDNEIADKILPVAKIAGIAAVISILGTIAGIAVLFLSPAPDPVLQQEGLDQASVQVAKTAPYLSAFMSAVIGGISFYCLFRFSRFAKSAQKTGNHYQLITSLKNLAGYFRLWAVLLFVVISFLGMAFIGGILSSLLG